MATHCEYRAATIDLGGVFIHLGQAMLSLRVRRVLQEAVNAVEEARAELSRAIMVAAEERMQRIIKDRKISRKVD